MMIPSVLACGGLSAPPGAGSQSPAGRVGLSAARHGRHPPRLGRRLLQLERPLPPIPHPPPSGWPQPGQAFRIGGLFSPGATLVVRSCFRGTNKFRTVLGRTSAASGLGALGSVRLSVRSRRSDIPASHSRSHFPNQKKRKKRMHNATHTLSKHGHLVGHFAL
jgi:hypothetical protein